MSTKNKGNPLGQEKGKVKYDVGIVTEGEARRKGLPILNFVDAIVTGLPDKRKSMTAEDDAYNRAIDDVIESIGKTGGEILRGAG